MVATGIRRGLAAGLLAGILTGVFALVVGHDPMATAIRIEESQHADQADDPAAQQDDDHGAARTDHDGSAHGTHHDDDDGHAHDDGDGHAQDDEHLVSRTTQQALLPVATVVVGLGLGGLFGLAFALLRPRRRQGDWQASLVLGGAAWSVTVLLPTLTSPATPPGVGDPSSVDARTQAYLLTVASGILVVAALYGLAGRLTRTVLRAPARQAVIGAVTLLAGAILVAVLPSTLPGDGLPAELVWRFRLASLGSQTLLWAGIAVGVGLLWERAVHGGLTRKREAPR